MTTYHAVTDIKHGDGDEVTTFAAGDEVTGLDEDTLEGLLEAGAIVPDNVDVDKASESELRSIALAIGLSESDIDVMDDKQLAEAIDVRGDLLATQAEALGVDGAEDMSVEELAAAVQAAEHGQ